MCTIPLTHEGTLTAVLALYTPTTAPFTEHQAQLLELLAPQLAAAVASVPAQKTVCAEPAADRRLASGELQLLRGGLSRRAFRS